MDEAELVNTEKGLYIQSNMYTGIIVLKYNSGNKLQKAGEQQIHNIPDATVYNYWNLKSVL